MAILEAMSWGIPIVTTPVGGIPEAISHNVQGLLVSPGNVQGLADALSSLLADASSARAMGQAGRARIERDFTHAVLIPRLEQLWEDSGASEQDIHHEAT